TVTFATDFTVVGRIAQFGRGIMEDVSRHLVGQMGECIRQKLEAPEGGAGAQAGDADGSGDKHRDQGTSGSYSDTAAPLDAFALGRAVARDRVGRLSESPQAMAMVAAGIGLLILVVLLRRRRG
ncbi:MAG TPA: hypothetical protein VII79_05530, partial [Candidatus Dormibacteraeota bacterium]